MALRASKTAMTMKAEGPMPKLAKALAPAIAAANIAIASPVFAEGTGEALGIDDTRLIVPVILIPVITFILYAGFASEQDNEDFFDTYDQRRK
uniref:PsbW n=1 Tax=Chroomonas placoidea TaxID=173977 RepID=A0AAU8MIF8_9CRYP